MKRNIRALVLGKILKYNVNRCMLKSRVVSNDNETRKPKTYKESFMFIHLIRLRTILLTYSMVQSPSWEANWFAASQEIPRISRNPKVHYRTHKRPPTVSILGQPNPVLILTSHLLEIHPNIIHPSTPRSPQWSPSLRFPQQDPVHPLSSPIRATCPAHLILLDFITHTILSEEYNIVFKI